MSADQCSICQNCNRDKSIPTTEEKHCFQKKGCIENYKPYSKQKKTILLTCTNFSHVRGLRATFRSR